MRTRLAPVRAAMIAIIAASYSGASWGATGDRERAASPVLKELLACRDIGAAAERLACYDSRTATIAAAEQAGEIVVADKTTVRETKKALFGYGGLNLPLFGKGVDAAAPTQIDAAVRSIRRTSYTRVEITLDNDMVWRQVDDEPIDPNPGQKVTVRTAAMGSYLLKVGSRSIRVMRVR